MVKLPAELTIVLEDLGGLYANGLACPIACALKRAGIEGDIVFGCGNVGFSRKREGNYAWADGEMFSARTHNRTGKLVLTVFEVMFDELEARYG